MNDVTPINQPSVKEQFWLEVMKRISESQRFLEFLKRNYTIGVSTDEETKEVQVQVVEAPDVVGPPLSGDQIFKIHAACLHSGAREPSVLVEKIMKILGQEAPKIELVSSMKDIDK